VPNETRAAAYAREIDRAARFGRREIHTIGGHGISTARVNSTNRVGRVARKPRDAIKAYLVHGLTLSELG